MIRTVQILTFILVFSCSAICQDVVSLPAPPPPPPPPSHYTELNLFAKIISYDEAFFDSCHFAAIESDEETDTLSFYNLYKRLGLRKNIKNLYNKDFVVTEKYKLFYSNNVFSSKKHLEQGYFYNTDNKLGLFVKFGDDSIAAEKEYYSYNRKGLLKKDLKFEYWSQAPDSVLISEKIYIYKKGLKHKMKILTYQNMDKDFDKPWIRSKKTFNSDGNIVKNLVNFYNQKGKTTLLIEEENFFNINKRLTRYIRSVYEIDNKKLTKKDFGIQYFDKRIKVNLIENDSIENEFEYIYIN